MEQPTASTVIFARPGLVCQLQKSFYGLKQAVKIWGSLLMETVTSFCFAPTESNSRVLTARTGNDFVHVLIVVDDMLFAINSRRLLDKLKDRLREHFDVKFFEELTTFIGWEIRRTSCGMKISQERYANEILHHHGLEEGNATWKPMAVDADLWPAMASEKTLSHPQHSEYRRIVGEILHLAVLTRPDIAFAVSALARSVHAPTMRHCEMVRRAWRYLSGT